MIAYATLVAEERGDMMYTTLYRPVGVKELHLIFDAEGRRYPKRLPTQPIFYPVLNHTYATEIAEKWNTKDENSGYVGYVTTFLIDSTYVSKYPVQQAGSSVHKELWVPAEELNEFNQNIHGCIHIMNAYYGSMYAKKEAIGMLSSLCASKDRNGKEFEEEIVSQWKTINQNYLLWTEGDISTMGINGAELLSSIADILKNNDLWFIKDIE